VLLELSGPLEEQERALLSKALGLLGSDKVIPVPGKGRLLIVKTRGEAVPGLREAAGRVNVRGKTVATALTSGSIGKLKRRASRLRDSDDVKVSER